MNEANVRMLENKVKSINEQCMLVIAYFFLVFRVEEREFELKNDYQRLHDLYTNLLRTYLEHVDRVRSMYQKNKSDNSSDMQTNNACIDYALQTRQFYENSTYDVTSQNLNGNLFDHKRMYLYRKYIF